MKKVLISLLLCTAILLSGCGKQQPTGPASVSLESGSCDSFGGLAWGTSYTELFPGDEPPTSATTKAELAGFPCVANYQFNSTGAQNAGYYQFNEDQSSSGTDIYTAVREAVVTAYGEPAESMMIDENGETVPAPTIEDVIQSGEGACTEQWTSVTDTDGNRIGVTLQLLETGEVSLQFYNPALMQ